MRSSKARRAALCTGDISQRSRATVAQSSTRPRFNRCCGPHATTQSSATRGWKLQPLGRGWGSRQKATSTCWRDTHSAQRSASHSCTWIWIPGSAWAKAGSARTSHPDSALVRAATRTTPSPCWRMTVSASLASAKASRARRTRGSSTSLAGVGRTPRAWRSKRRTPTKRSRSARSCVAAGWLRCSASAERFRLPSSTSLMKRCRWRRRAPVISLESSTVAGRVSKDISKANR